MDKNSKRVFYAFLFSASFPRGCAASVAADREAVVREQQFGSSQQFGRVRPDFQGLACFSANLPAELE